MAVNDSGAAHYITLDMKNRSPTDAIQFGDIISHNLNLAPRSFSEAITALTSGKLMLKHFCCC